MESKFYGSEDEPLSGDDGWFTEAAKAAYANTLMMLESEKAGTVPNANDVAGAEAGDGGDAAEDGSDDVAPEEVSEDALAAAGDIPDLEGSGWVIELSGYHFHNLQPPMYGSEYVKRTLVKQLMTGKVRLPVGQGRFEEFTMEELGISHALIAQDGGINRKMKIDNPDWEPPRWDDMEMEAPVGGLAALTQQNQPEKKEPEVPRFLKPRTHRFKVHFLWRPTLLSERLEARRSAAEGNTDNQLAEGDS